ncbi:MAG: ABC transporter permease [Opitutales bacterium]
MISLRFLHTVQLGIKSLLLHKMRSALTMLGIIFGVCSVIAMLAIGEGASYEAQQSIKELGSSNIILRSVKPPEDSREPGEGQSRSIEYGLTYADSNRISTTIPGVSRVLPMRIIRENARFNERERQANIIGTVPSYLEFTPTTLVRGRFLTEMDELYRRNICVISANLATRLFDFRDPIGNEVKVGSNYYRVVGIVAEPQLGVSASANSGRTDSNIFIPLSTARSRFGETIIRRTSGSLEAERVQLHQLTVQFDSTDHVETAVAQVETMLARFHRHEDYEVVVPLQLLRQAEQSKRIFNIVLGSIAAISLLVGGIGIMNIMLATVTERTREIGIRRALGAKKKDIVTQFLVETVVLSIGGGIVGLAAGVLIPTVVSYFTEMMTVVTPWSLLLAFGISATIGIVFGLYPASRAANMDPIEALRHE